MVDEVRTKVFAFSEARARLLSLLGDMHALSPDAAFETILTWYAAEACLEVQDPAGGGDMLLFQYGSYDWGTGRKFEINLARQFEVPEGIAYPPEEDTADQKRGDDPQDVLFQLGLTFRYAPSPALTALGRFDKWLQSPAGLTEFRHLITNSPALHAVEGLTTDEIVLEGFDTD